MTAQACCMMHEPMCGLTLILDSLGEYLGPCLIVISLVQIEQRKQPDVAQAEIASGKSHYSSWLSHNVSQATS